MPFEALRLTAFHRRGSVRRNAFVAMPAANPACQRSAIESRGARYSYGCGRGQAGRRVKGHCCHALQAGRVHFVGIGGAGLAPLAVLASRQGWRVSGSDANEGTRTKWVAGNGCVVAIGHRADNLWQPWGGQPCLPNVVVASSAIPADNPEIQAAHAVGLPVMKRSQWLSAATAGFHLAAVAGTHGKTTTSAMLTMALSAVMDGEVIAVVGGDVPQFPEGHGYMIPQALGVLKRQDPMWFVLEADEYDGAFLGVCPSVAVITNVELDHVDCYQDEDAFKSAFVEFIQQIQPGGVLVVCAEDEGALEVAVSTAQIGDTRWQVNYGFSCCDWVAAPQPSCTKGMNNFQAWFRGELMAEVHLKVPGRHNILNALGALAAASTISSKAGPHAPCKSAAMMAAKAISGFTGVRRRFEHIGTCQMANGLKVDVIDDYAHHPTEISATLSAAREVWGADNTCIVAVFQPHTYTRLKAFLADFATSFSDADMVVVLDVFGAREEMTDSNGATSMSLVECIQKLVPDKNVVHLPGSLQSCAPKLAAHLLLRAVGESVVDQHCVSPPSHAAVVFLGAGDVTCLGPLVLEQLEGIGQGHSSEGF